MLVINFKQHYWDCADEKQQIDLSRHLGYSSYKLFDRRYFLSINPNPNRNWCHDKNGKLQWKNKNAEQ